jgi:hypothetical protein
MRDSRVPATSTVLGSTILARLFLARLFLARLTASPLVKGALAGVLGTAGHFSEHTCV